MMLVPLSYSQLFNDDSFYDSLKNIEIPSSLVITLLSGINHKLFIKENPDKIFQIIIQGWDQEFKEAFNLGIREARNKTNAIIPIEEFQKMIPSNEFKLIYKPILISLDFIFSRKILFASVRLDKIIKMYHKQIHRFESNLKRGKYLDEKKWFKSITGQYNSIEQCHIEFREINENDYDKDDRIIHRILDKFGVEGNAQNNS